MHLAFSLIIMLIAFMFASLTVFQCFYYLAGSPSRNNPKLGRLFVYSLGTGPILLSWLLIMMFLVVPGKPLWSYIATIITLLCAPLLILDRKPLSTAPSLFSNAIANIKNDMASDNKCLLAYTAALILLILAFTWSSILPYTANDALEYAMLGKLMYLQKSARMYPILNGANTGGFIAPFTHPLAFVGLYIWTYIFQGSAKFIGLAKYIASLYLLYTAITIAALTRPINKFLAAVAVILYISTPVFVFGVTQYQIDSLRLFTFFLFFMFIPELYKNSSWGHIIIAGILLGMCLFSHSINILAIPMFAILYFIFLREAPHQGLKKVLSVISIGLLFVLPRYLVNLQTIGHIISDGTSVRSVTTLHYYATREIAREVFTATQKWTRGFLGPFYIIKRYGIAYLLLIFGLFFISTSTIKNLITKGIEISKYEDGITPISVLIIFGFFGAVALSLVLKMDNFIINYRYLLSELPFVAIVAGWVVVKLYQKIFYNRYHLAIPTLILVTFLLPLPFFANSLVEFNVDTQTIHESDFTKALIKLPTYKAIDYYNKHASNDSVLLAFKNGETAYNAKTYFIYSADPRLKPLYEAKTIKKCLSLLHKLKINFILTPPYASTFFNHSCLSKVASNPQFSKLVYQSKGAKLFKLYSHPPRYTLKNISIKNRGLPKRNITEQATSWHISSRPSYLSKSDGLFVFNNDQQASKNTLLFTGKSEKRVESYDFLSYFNNPHPILHTPYYANFPVSPEHHYLLIIKASGYGSLNAYIAKYHNTKSLDLDAIWNINLFSNHSNTYKIPFLVSGLYANHFQLAVILHGLGWANIQKVSLKEIKYPQTIEQKKRTTLKHCLAQEGWAMYLYNPLYHYLSNLKALIVHSNNTPPHHNEDWTVTPYSNNKFIIHFKFNDQNTYAIKSAPTTTSNCKMPFQIIYYISGHGMADIELVEKNSLQMTVTLAHKTIKLKEDYQKISFALSSKKIKHLISNHQNINTFYTITKITKQSGDKYGAINIAIGMKDRPSSQSHST